MTPETLALVDALRQLVLLVIEMAEAALIIAAACVVAYLIGGAWLAWRSQR